MGVIHTGYAEAFDKISHRVTISLWRIVLLYSIKIITNFKYFEGEIMKSRRIARGSLAALVRGTALQVIR